MGMNKTRSLGYYFTHRKVLSVLQEEGEERKQFRKRRQHEGSGTLPNGKETAQIRSRKKGVGRSPAERKEGPKQS